MPTSLLLKFAKLVLIANAARCEYTRTVLTPGNIKTRHRCQEFNISSTTLSRHNQ